MRSSFLLAASAALVVITYTSEAFAAPPEISAGLRPPSGEVLFLEALASGVQIYECTPKADQPAVYEWVFRAPEATLTDRAGRPLGTHYAGPTWKATDGSLVVAAVKARDPGPSPSAIPWLLLSAKSTAGSGTFSGSKHIQRVDTVGGVAPVDSCSATNAKQTVRVPYTATYYFYR